MKFRWSLAPPQPLLAGQLASQLKLPPLLAQCLLNRGFSEPSAIEKFLSPRLKNLSDPFLLPNMAVAVGRLLRAREQNESLVIFGDYDVDGVTSTALLVEVLRPLGWKVDFYLPNRMDEGYGLSADGVENCLKKHPTTLLLAVDCGSTAVETIKTLRSRGVEVIVLDHHQVSNPAPDAVALVNPQLCRTGVPPVSNQSPAQAEQKEGDRQGACPTFTELCSVGLAFKLAHALVKRGREIGLPGAAEFDLRPLLDLVALGTIADLVPLTGENRILKVHFGFRAEPPQCNPQRALGAQRIESHGQKHFGGGACVMGAACAAGGNRHPCIIESREKLGYFVLLPGEAQAEMDGKPLDGVTDQVGLRRRGSKPRQDLFPQSYKFAGFLCHFLSCQNGGHSEAHDPRYVFRG